ncbi:MAG: hypothetical protein B7Z66_12090 [Chromatiales bacterium 21-64-14]|nr:MAG: hypothetical protein B7Z66_12090 [Chromatiales bacterium 21-64-14]
MLSDEFMESRKGTVRNGENRWSDLVLRVRAGSGSLSVDWLRRRWVGKPGGRRIFATRLRKGTGFRYPKRELLRWAKDWERDEVWQAECRMALLRELWQIGKMMERAERKYLGVNTGVFDTEDEASRIDDEVGFIPDRQGPGGGR